MDERQADHTAEIVPDNPGTYEVNASCGTSSQTYTLHTVQVTLDADPVVTGFSKPDQLLKIRDPKVTVTVVPPELAPEIDLRVPPPTRIRILKEEINAEVGTITFPVRGLSATPENPEGDTKIEAPNKVISPALVDVAGRNEVPRVALSARGARRRIEHQQIKNHLADDSGVKP